MVRIISILLIAFLHISYATATTYYVRSATGSDLNSGTTAANAFQTLTKVFSGTPALNDGDTINILGTFNFPASQLITKSIMIQGTNRWQSVIKGLSGAKARCFTIGDANNTPTVVIEEVTFRDFDNWDEASSLQGGVLQINQGSNITCRRVNFFNNQSYLGGAVNLVSGVAVFEDCYFRDNKAKIRTGATNAAGGAVNVSVSSNNSTVSLKVDRCLFENNSTENIASAIRFTRTASNGNSILLIQNSTFFGNTVSSTSSSVTAGAVLLDVKSTGADDIKLINNTIAYNVSEVNNTNARAGLSILGIDNKVKLINNILYSNINATNNNLSISASYKLNESRNNITDQNYNFILNTMSGFSSDNQINVIDSQLVMRNSLTPQGGSTSVLAIGVASIARNAGYAIGAPLIDQRRVTRVGGVDVGAYEVIPWRSSLYPENWTPGFTDGQGRFFHDFSYAGYKMGMQDIPVITNNIVDITQPPYNADNTGSTNVTTIIQTALNNMGIAGGGVVYLPEGTYNIAVESSKTNALHIMYDNVVLRGAGTDKTFIVNTSTNIRNKHVIYITPSGTSPWNTPVGSVIPLSQDVPQGSFVVPLNNVTGLAVGDMVIIATDCTPEFIAEHQATALWDSSVSGQRYCRIIQSVNPANMTVTIDIPIRYTVKTRDNARMYKIKSQVRGSGIEDLSIGNVQNPKINGFSDDDYAFEVPGTGAYEVHFSHFITVRNAQDCWIRNVSSFKPESNVHDIHLLSNGIYLHESKNVTITDCSLANPQYRGGGGNGYMYTLAGNDCLISNSSSTRARHSYSFKYMYAHGNVLLRCRGVDSRLSADFHMYLSMANLFDSFVSDGDYIEAVFRPRSSMPSHGYTTTETVFWNTQGIKAHPVKNFLIHSLQWKHGYIIGTSGVVNNIVTQPFSGIADFGLAYDTSPEDWKEGLGSGDRLLPQSLYEDQLNKRQSNPNYVKSVNHLLNPHDRGVTKNIKMTQLSPDMIEFELPSQYNKYTIYNIHGQQVLFGQISQNGMKFYLSINQLRAGIYIVKFEGPELITESVKIVK